MNIETIWQEYRTSLLRFLSSKVSNESDVEDLLQVILIKTHKNLTSLTSEDKIKPWLFQIANRSIIDFYRHQASQRELKAEDLWFETYETNELARCIEPFIQGLPDKHSNLLRSIELNGESQKNYAERNNLSYSTLKSRVQKSRQELKKLFEQCCSIHLDSSGNSIACNSSSEECDQC